MANILYTPTLAGNATPASVDSVRMPVHYEERLVDFATALTIKGSALASADVIQAIPIPPNAVVLAAGVQIIVAANSTTTTVGIGNTVSTSIYVTGFDVQGGTVGACAPSNSAAYPTVYGAAGTVDVILSTLTGTLSTGQIRVWALYGDTNAERNPGITARKS